MALLNLCMKFENLFGRNHSLSIMKIALRNNIHNMPQGPPNPGFMREKVQKGDFLNKGLVKIEIFSLLKVPMNLPKAWNTKLGAGIFLVV